MTFASKTVYKLKDPESYDDEDFGTGYDHVETFGDADGMHMTDCWIVNAQGDVHPGYNECPVPVRYCDVEPSALPAKNTGKGRASFAGWI